MKFVVDEIIDGIVKLEDIATKEKKEVNIRDLPEGTKEGCVLKVVEGSYVVDKVEEKIRREIMRKKMERLKALKK